MKINVINLDELLGGDEPEKPETIAEALMELCAECLMAGVMLADSKTLEEAKENFGSDEHGDKIVEELKRRCEDPDMKMLYTRAIGLLIERRQRAIIGAFVMHSVAMLHKLDPDAVKKLDEKAGVANRALRQQQKKD